MRTFADAELLHAFTSQSIWLLILFSFPSLSDETVNTSSSQRFGTGRFDSATIGALFFTMGVMIADRIIYRLWAPPMAIEAALSHSAVAHDGATPGLETNKQRRGSAPVVEHSEPESAAPALKLLLHVVVTGVVHGTSFFALKLWTCSRSEMDCEGGRDTGGKACGGCHPSAVVRIFYILACLYLFLSASQLRLGFPLAPRDHPLTESGVL